MSTTLRRGKLTLPLFGLGTYLSESEDVGPAVKHALEVGYTLIDTAQLYANEEAIGRVLAGRPRDSFQIVTKMSENHPNAEAELTESLRKLGLDYVDLYLIHTPRNKECLETWKNMLKLRDRGLAKAVGVSNFGKKQLEELEKCNVELPEVNQIELHVWNQQRELVSYLKEKDIAVMAYCPLARGKKWGSLGGSVQEEAVWAMRWCEQKGYICIPKTVTLDRVKTNFEWTRAPLSEEKMAELDTRDEGLRVARSVHDQDLAWEDVR